MRYQYFYVTASRVETRRQDQYTTYLIKRNFINAPEAIRWQGSSDILNSCVLSTAFYRINEWMNEFALTVIKIKSKIIHLS